MLAEASSARRESRPRDIEHEALTMALAIVAQRIESLPKEDRDDLCELVKELGKAESSDEFESVVVTMREILDQAPVRLRKFDQTSEFRPGKGLQRWIGFVSGRIRSLREQAGLTQVQLAKKSGLPQSHISRLENGEHSPSHVTLEKIANALGVPVSELAPPS